MTIPRAYKRIAAACLAVAVLLGMHGAYVLSNADALGTSGREDIGLGTSGTDENDREPAPQEPDDIDQPSLGISGADLSAANEITVDNEADFRAAVTGGLYSTIYLGKDISMDTADFMQITSPVNMVIDGQGHTINEVRMERHINVQPGAQGSHITLKNTTVIGYDYFGFIGTRNGDVPNATLVFDNVTYTGPQMTHWRGTGSGKTVIKDCTITIQNNGSGSHPANEVWEGAILEFEGMTSINHTSTTHPMLFCYQPADARPEYGGARRAFVLKEGAVVTGTTSLNIFQTDNSSQTALILEPGSVFSIESSGFMTSGQSVYYAEIGESAGLYLKQTGNRSTTAFNVQNNLVLQSDSVLRIEKSTSEIAAYVYGTVTLNHPRLFYVKSASTGMAVNGARNWTVNGVNVVNFTSTAGKTYYWNRQDDTLPTFDWTATGTALTSSHELTDIYGNTMTRNTLDLGSTRAIAIGNYARGLTADTAMQAVVIAGETAPLAGLQASFYREGFGSGATFLTSGAADRDGMFSLSIPAGENLVSAHEAPVVHLRGYDQNGDLIADRLLPVSDKGKATLSVTSLLDFGVQTIPNSPEQMLGRTATMSIRLEDTAILPRDWQLLASESQPLSGPTTVSGAFVYQKSGRQARLNADDQRILDFSNPGGRTDWSQQLDYDRDEGIVISVAPGEVLTGEYAGTITWTLVNA